MVVLSRTGAISPVAGACKRNCLKASSASPLRGALRRSPKDCGLPPAVAWLTVFAFAAFLALPSVAAARREGLPELAVPYGFGTNIHFTGEPKDLDLIRAAGFKFIRMDLAWGGIERQKGVYEFEKTGYDALTQGCIKRGIRILYILDYSNKLYEQDRSVRTEEGRKAFAAFAEAAATRYKGKGILWEIWNEPNIKQFWRPQPSVEDYCKLVEQTAPLIRKADPSGTVVAPATSTIPFDWLEACFKKGLLKWIDVLSVHPYRPQPPETVIKDYKRLRELIKRYAPEGKDIPIISGEWGYSNVNWDNTRLSNEQQGQYLARMFIINLYQKIPVSIWYDWINDGTNPDEREHNFGTVTHELKPKTAYMAARTLATWLEGYSIQERIDIGDDADFAFKFEKGHNIAVVFWTTKQEHEVTVPLPAGKGSLLSMLGEQRKLSWQSSGLKITASASPQYLRFRAEDNLELTAATYLSGPGSDTVAAIDIAPDKTIVLLANIKENNFGITPTELLDVGDGVVMRFNSTATKILSLTRIGKSVDDMEINRTTGEIAVIGEFGAVLLSPQADKIVWHKSLEPKGGGATASRGRRIAIGNKGTVAALHGKRVSILNKKGEFQAGVIFEHNFVEDVAIDDNTGHLFTVGFDYKRTPAQDKGYSDWHMQIAYMYCHDLQGKEKWSNYQWSAVECDNGNEADSRALRIAMGRDGKLYLGGETMGANSIFRWNPKKLGEKNYLAPDKYHSLENVAVNRICYYARFDPATGELLRGQFLLSRRGSDVGNSARFQAVTADENGNVYVAGVSAYTLDRDNLPTVAGNTVAPAGGFVLVVAPDFSERLLWTTFEKQAYSSSPWAIAAAAGVVAVGSDVAKPAMVTHNAIQDNHNEPTKESTDIYIAVFDSPAK